MNYLKRTLSEFTYIFLLFIANLSKNIKVLSQFNALSIVKNFPLCRFKFKQNLSGSLGNEVTDINFGIYLFKVTHLPLSATI